jgi:hypothetical protein
MVGVKNPKRFKGRRNTNTAAASKNNSGPNNTRRAHSPRQVRK